MRKFSTNILVRDKRLEMMQGDGLNVKYEVLSDEDYIEELKKKAVEESEELQRAEGLDDIKEEVADVMEVLEHIVSFYNIKTEELEAIKKKKQDKIGKFERRIKTYYVEMADDNEDVEYYAARPHKYPEVV